MPTTEKFHGDNPIVPAIRDWVEARMTLKKIQSEIIRCPSATKKQALLAYREQAQAEAIKSEESLRTLKNRKDLPPPLHKLLAYKPPRCRECWSLAPDDRHPECYKLIQKLYNLRENLCDYAFNTNIV